jgi:hypothetical protein
VKGGGWSSMQAFLRSCSVTRDTVDFFFNPIINYPIVLAVLGTE